MRQVKVIEHAEELLQVLLDERDARIEKAAREKCIEPDGPTIAIHVNLYDETAEIMGAGSNDYIIDGDLDVYEFLQSVIREAGLPVEVVG